MERSKPLHNFSLPPGLTWGRQRSLRCMNVNPIRTMTAVDDDDDHESLDSGEYNKNRFVKNPRAEVEEFERQPGGIRSSDDCRKRVRFNLKSLSFSPSPVPEIGSVRKRISGDKDEISVTRQKLVMDFQTEVGKLKEAILKNNTSDDQISPVVKVSPPLPVAEPNTTPVNSIKQKSTYNTPPPDAICTEGGEKGGINADVDDPRSEKKSTRPKRKKEERAKFSISLSRKEIEDDFITMTGKKPPRKPKKWPRNIQTELQGVFPGSWLSEVHPDRYKINENGKS